MGTTIQRRAVAAHSVIPSLVLLVLVASAALSACASGEEGTTGQTASLTSPQTLAAPATEAATASTEATASEEATATPDQTPTPLPTPTAIPSPTPTAGPPPGVPVAAPDALPPLTHDLLFRDGANLKVWRAEAGRIDVLAASVAAVDVAAGARVALVVRPEAGGAGPTGNGWPGHRTAGGPCSSRPMRTTSRPGPSSTSPWPTGRPSPGSRPWASCRTPSPGCHEHFCLDSKRG